MNKFKMPGLVNQAGMAIRAHSSDILTGVGIAGMATSTILAVAATPKALRILEMERECRQDTADDTGFEYEPITKKDAIKLCWKNYIPAFGVGALSVACIIGAKSIDSKKNAALAAAYELSRSALNQYKEAVEETVEEKVLEQINTRVADKRTEKPIQETEIIPTEYGNELFYDAWSGRYFRSSPNHIEHVENILNEKLRNEIYVSVNELYYELGIPCIKFGNETGWNINDGDIDLRKDETSLTKAGGSCVVLDYDLELRFDYRNLH